MFIEETAMNSIETRTNLKDSAIVFYKNKDLKEIIRFSGMTKSSNEYQVHYTALVKTIFFKNDTKVIYVFPLIYYNYPQKVTMGSIDFDMKDVSKKADSLIDYSNFLARDLIEKFKAKEVENKDIEKVKYKVTLFNNIHRHP